MDSEKLEHLAFRKAIKVVFDRQRLFQLDMIENVSAPESPGPRMHRMVKEADWIIFVFHHETKVENDLLIRVGIKTEMDLASQLGKPAIAFIEKTLQEDKSDDAIRTMQTIWGMNVFSKTFYSLEELIIEIERALVDILREGAKEYGESMVRNRPEATSKQGQSIDQSEAQS
jgi:hypothetical protein